MIVLDAANSLVLLLLYLQVMEVDRYELKHATVEKISLTGALHELCTCGWCWFCEQSERSLIVAYYLMSSILSSLRVSQY